MANLTVTNLTLVDVCNFPSVRFGTYYTSQLSGDILTDVPDGVDVVHPDNDSYTVDENTVTSHIQSGLPSVSEESDISVTSNAGGNKVNVTPEYTSRGATVRSTFGGVASDVNVVEATDGYVVIGKQCEV